MSLIISPSLRKEFISGFDGLLFCHEYVKQCVIVPEEEGDRISEEVCNFFVIEICGDADDGMFHVIRHLSQLDDHRPPQ